MVIYAVHPIIYAPTPIKPIYQSLFCLNNRWNYNLSIVDFETEVRLTIVLRRHRTRIR